MAALTRHAFLGCALARPILARCTNAAAISARGISFKKKKPAQKPVKKATVESIMASIEAKGFLRPYKPYQPPLDVSERIDKICKSHGLSIDDQTPIEDLKLRFYVFVNCEEEFSHDIPSSRLPEIETVGDLRKFYKTPVFTTTPLEALQNMELPPNLHVQQEYVRFHPDTDKIADGVSAFPESATLVSGLKYKDKYPGHKPEKKWPIKVHSIFDD